MKTGSTPISLYESLLENVHRMIEVCEQQQDLLANGPLEELAATMAERETLVSAMQETHAKLTTMLADKRDKMEELRLAELKREVEEGIQQFLHLDQIVQHLLTKKGELMVNELLERFKTVSGISEYRHVDKNTDLIARIFQGNSRSFDEKS